jgi:hypothetical protein
MIATLYHKVGWGVKRFFYRISDWFVDIATDLILLPVLELAGCPSGEYNSASKLKL